MYSHQELIPRLNSLPVVLVEDWKHFTNNYVSKSKPRNMVRFSSQTTVILLAELALFEFLPPTFLSYQYLTAVSQISIKNCFTKLAAL